VSGYQKSNKNNQSWKNAKDQSFESFSRTKNPQKFFFSQKKFLKEISSQKNF